MAHVRVLTLLQATGFTLLETIERLPSGGVGEVAELASEPAFTLGLAIQIVVAFVAAIVLTLFGRVIRSLTRRRATTLSSDAVESAWSCGVRPLSRLVSGGATPRAPPHNRAFSF